MARLARAGIAGAAALVAACFSTPSFHADDARRSDGRTSDGNSGDANGDSIFTGVDGNPIQCRTDDFGSGGGCGSSGWATMAASGGSAYVSSGQLQLTLFSSASSFAQCDSPSTSYTRFTVDVTSAAQNLQGDNTFVGFYNNLSQRFGVVFTWDSANNVAGFQPVCATGASATTNPLPADARFIQVQQDVPGHVQISKSLDGNLYTLIAQCNASGGLTNAAARLAIARGSNSSAPTSVTSQFNWIELCHP